MQSCDMLTRMLHYALDNNDMQLAEYALAEGASVNGVFRGSSPLARAAFYMRDDQVLWLLRRGADPNIPFRGRFPLDMYATRADCLTELKALFKAGATGAGGSTRHLLQLAAPHASVDVMRLLLAHGAEVDFCLYESTALLSALNWARRSVVKWLLKHGASPDRLPSLKREPRCIPLFLAAASGDPSMIELLLKAGADASVVDVNGKTAAEYVSGKPGSAAFKRCKKLLQAEKEAGK